MEGHKLLPFLERVRVTNPHRGSCPCGWAARSASAPELVRSQFAEHLVDEEVLDEVERAALEVEAAEIELAASKAIRDAAILKAVGRLISERKVADRAHVSPARVNQIRNAPVDPGSNATD